MDLGNSQSLSQLSFSSARHNIPQSYLDKDFK